MINCHIPRVMYEEVLGTNLSSRLSVLLSLSDVQLLELTSLTLATIPPALVNCVVIISTVLAIGIDFGSCGCK